MPHTRPVESVLSKIVGNGLCYIYNLILLIIFLSIEGFVYRCENFSKKIANYQIEKEHVCITLEAKSLY